MEQNTDNKTLQKKAADIVNEVRKVVLGKDDIIDKVMCAIAAGGHILLDDIPGVGKTTMALSFSKAMSLDYSRLQFTPDVLPTDVTGFSIYDKKTDSFVYKPGAAICNLFLADEINRTSSKTQSALLEIMEEGRVTVDGVTREMPKPFCVIATENPIGYVGTQMLPESQLDRFMVQLSLGYPDKESETLILKNRQGANPLDSVNAVAAADDIINIQKAAEGIFTHDKIYEYIAEIANATRNHEMIELGLSPRGTLAITKLARAHAFLCGREFVAPDDVADVLFDAAIHRIVLSPKARIANKDARTVLEEIIKSVKLPKVEK